MFKNQKVEDLKLQLEFLKGDNSLQSMSQRLDVLVELHHLSKRSLWQKFKDLF